MAKNVGPINDALYNVLGPDGRKDGIADVVSGNDSVTRQGEVVVTGSTATRVRRRQRLGHHPGQHLRPGVGRCPGGDHQERAVRGAGKEAALTKLEHREQLSNHHVGQGDTTLLTAQGLLPGIRSS